MSKQLRYFIGSLATLGALYNSIIINKTNFVEDGQIKEKRIATLQGLPFIQPQEGDLVLTLDNKKYQFKVIETKAGKYTALNKYGMSMLVPQGFALLRNIENGQKTLQCYGSIVGQTNYDISWLPQIF